tara:strand:+ start:3816 stop:4007 length:192 start_codon:yes stop_codon:yes gene_type:complete
MNTQGTGVTRSEGLSFNRKGNAVEAPFEPHHRNVFTDVERSELKQIFCQAMEEFFATSLIQRS